MTSNKKILLFSFLALTTLCVQKNINAGKGGNRKTSPQNGKFSFKNRKADQRYNKKSNHQNVSKKAHQKFMEAKQRARREEAFRKEALGEKTN